MRTGERIEVCSYQDNAISSVSLPRNDVTASIGSLVSAVISVIPLAAVLKSIGGDIKRYPALAYFRRWMGQKILKIPMNIGIICCKRFLKNNSVVFDIEKLLTMLLSKTIR